MSEIDSKYIITADYSQFTKDFVDNCRKVKI